MNVDHTNQIARFDLMIIRNVEQAATPLLHHPLNTLALRSPP
jgi:hypothetical protein